MPPSLSASVGVPVTVTFSLNVTVMAIGAPVPRVPAAVVVLTPVTVGVVASMMMLSSWLSEFAAPAHGSVRVAATPPTFLIVPFSAVADASSRLAPLVVSPLATV